MTVGEFYLPTLCIYFRQSNKTMGGKEAPFLLTDWGKEQFHWHEYPGRIHIQVVCTVPPPPNQGLSSSKATTRRSVLYRTISAS